MDRNLKILILILSLALPLTISASKSEVIFMGDIVAQAENTMDIEVLINSTQKIKLEAAPKKGYLEVYSIIGAKVKSVNLRNCEDGCFLDLPKGLYIIKAGKVTQKVIVR